MDETGHTLSFPDLGDIIEINRRQVQTYGGSHIPPDNARNAASLKWVLEAIQYPLGNTDLYPTVADKAAALAWTIITRHVFHDGNKRTGMSSLELFLRLNDYRLFATDDEVVEIAVQVASPPDAPDHCSRADLARWVDSRLIQRFL